MYSDVDALHRASTALVNRRAEQSVTNEQAERRIVQLEREIRSAFFDTRHITADVAAKHRELEQLLRDASRTESDASLLTSRLQACTAIKSSVEAQCTELREAAESRINQLSCFPSDVAHVIRAARERQDVVAVLKDCKGLYNQLWAATDALARRDAIREFCAALQYKMGEIREATTRTNTQHVQVSDAVVTLKTQCERKGDALRVTLHEAEQARHHVGEINAELAAVDDACHEGKSQLHAAGARRVRVESSVASLKLQISAATQAIASRSAAAKEREIRLKAELQEATARHEALSTEVQNARERGAASRAATDALTSQLDDLRDKTVEVTRQGVLHARWAVDLRGSTIRRCQELVQQQRVLERQEVELLQRIGTAKMAARWIQDVVSKTKDLASEESLARAVLRDDEVQMSRLIAEWSSMWLQSGIPLMERQTRKRADVEASWLLGFQGLSTSFTMQRQQLLDAAAEREVAAAAAAMKPPARVSRGSGAKRSPITDPEQQPPRPQPASVSSRRRTLALKRRDSVSSQESTTGWIFADTTVPAASQPPAVTPFPHRSAVGNTAAMLTSLSSDARSARRALFVDAESPSPRNPLLPTPAKSVHQLLPTPAKTQHVSKKFTLGGSGSAKKPAATRPSTQVQKHDVFDIFDL